MDAKIKKQNGQKEINIKNSTYDSFGETKENHLSSITLPNSQKNTQDQRSDHFQQNHFLEH